MMDELYSQRRYSLKLIVSHLLYNMIKEKARYLSTLWQHIFSLPKDIWTKKGKTFFRYIYYWLY